MDSKYKVIHILVLLFLLMKPKSINAQERDLDDASCEAGGPLIHFPLRPSEDETEFSYEEESEKGPKHWGGIKKEWGACNLGNMQSPIDINHHASVAVVVSDSLSNNYKTANATLTNRGHDIQVKWQGDAGAMIINETTYSLQYAHWHTPSEHTVNGRRYDMELHLVHTSTTSQVRYNTSVLGILYKIGKPDKFLSKIMKNVSSIMDEKHKERPVGNINPRKINSGGKLYYRYMGSLTVPPCTEGVVWTINKKVKTVSRNQIKLLREAVHDYAEKNARPLQEKNNREIYFYNEADVN